MITMREVAERAYEIELAMVGVLETAKKGTIEDSIVLLQAVKNSKNSIKRLQKDIQDEINSRDEKAEDDLAYIVAYADGRIESLVRMLAVVTAAGTNELTGGSL